MRPAILTAIFMLSSSAAQATDSQAPLAVKITRADADSAGYVKVDFTNQSADELRQVTLRFAVAQADGVTVESRVIVRNVAAGEQIPALVKIPGLDDLSGVDDVKFERASVVTHNKRRPVSMDVAVDASELTEPR